MKNIILISSSSIILYCTSFLYLSNNTVIFGENNYTLWSFTGKVKVIQTHPGGAKEIDLSSIESGKENTLNVIYAPLILISNHISGATYIGNRESSDYWRHNNYSSQELE